MGSIGEDDDDEDDDDDDDDVSSGSVAVEDPCERVIDLLKSIHPKLSI